MDESFEITNKFNFHNQFLVLMGHCLLLQNKKTLFDQKSKFLTKSSKQALMPIL